MYLSIFVDISVTFLYGTFRFKHQPSELWRNSLGLHHAAFLGPTTTTSPCCALHPRCNSVWPPKCTRSGWHKWPQCPPWSECAPQTRVSARPGGLVKIARWERQLSSPVNRIMRLWLSDYLQDWRSRNIEKNPSTVHATHPNLTSIELKKIGWDVQLRVTQSYHTGLLSLLLEFRFFPIHFTPILASLARWLIRSRQAPWEVCPSTSCSAQRSPWNHQRWSMVNKG